MCKCFKRIACLTVTALIVFYAIALWSGGEKFRWFGEKTGGVIKENSEKLGKKADEIKERKDEAARTVKKITGSDKEEAEHTSSGTSNRKAKKPENSSAEDDGNKTPADSLHLLWNSIQKKIRALTKG
ncbi:MAG: hypothetical protein ABSB95_06630 [Dissulfurispiraceae bacterium]|jgi:hypothetical protein